MTRLLTLALMTTFTSVALCEEPQKSPASAGKPIGYWKPISVVYDGTEQFADAKSRDSIILVVKDNDYRIYMIQDRAKDTGVRLVTAEVAMDAAAKTLTMTIKEGPRKGTRCHGIFEMSDNKLKLCYGPSDRPRPTTFASPAGSQYFCETWEAEKK